MPTITRYISDKWWLRMSLHTLFILFGQSAAIVLGRLYYNKGGKSKWMVTLVQYVGFPILIPYFTLIAQNPTTDNFLRKRPSTAKLVRVYIPFGVFQAANTMMYSIGLFYLPISTFTLLSTFQLAFNAFFSIVLQQQKLTPFLINSLFLLTISSTLLVLQSDSMNPAERPDVNYTVGFISTVVASVGYGLILPLIELTFKKVWKKKTFAAVLEMIIYMSVIATCVAAVGLAVSGEWKDLKGEMEEFGLGKLSYVMTLAQAALASQAFAVGTVGLISEVSSLFSNSLSVLGLPLVPILAMIFLHENMDGIKVLSLGLAVWGFVSYVFQYFFGSSMPKKETSSDFSKLGLLEKIVWR